MSQQKPAKKIGFTQWFLIFLISFFVFKFFFPAQAPTENPENAQTETAVALTLKPTKENYTLGETVMLTFDNKSTKTYSLTLDCPNAPFSVERFVDGNWIALQASNEKTTCSAVAPANSKHWIDTANLAPTTARTINYADWNHELFGEVGKYRIQTTLTQVFSQAEIDALMATAQAEAETHPEYQEIETDAGTVVEQLPIKLDQAKIVIPEVLNLEAQFEVSGRSWFGWIWETLIYYPIFNLLIFLASILPNHNLGWAIIILTILIRIILLIPNQKALRSQRSLQEVQPKLQELQLKYANNKPKLAEETMALWKKHKINPFGSCLPMFIQLPILIALFYSVRSLSDNFSTSQSASLYGTLANFNLDLLSFNFYGLDMAVKGTLWVAIALAVLQFIQMKLSFKKPAKKPDQKLPADASQTMTSTMLYLMPLMIGFMSYTFPLAVSFYWATTTIFGIGQQIVVNNQKVL